MVPIVEPDLVLKGAHSLEDAVEANSRVLGELVRGLQDYGVHLPGTLLKTNLVRQGRDCATAYTPEAIADANLRVLRRVLPVAIAGRRCRVDVFTNSRSRRRRGSRAGCQWVVATPRPRDAGRPRAAPGAAAADTITTGVNYLSGGLSLAEGTAILNAMNVLKAKRGGPGYAPWNLSFSWSACIQLPLFDLCKTLPADASGLPRKEIQELYVKNLSVACASAKGALQ